MDIPLNETMSRKEAGNDLKDKIVKARANTDRVIISVYTESLRKRLQQKHNPATKKTTKTRGYDRRAQLLSYVSELRCAGSEPMERSRRDSRSKSKKWKWSTATIRESFLRMTQQKERQWGYERIVTEENGEPDQLQGSKRINSRNQTGSRNSNFCVNPNNHSSCNLFCRYTVAKLHKFIFWFLQNLQTVLLQKKLMSMLKELTCGLQCNKGCQGEISSTASSWFK
ncbi:hypothetical protein DKX38_008056 [Salix brachista]|uniref:Uncharacterized protein n=1 Tax=Salix brachista TaxID=2182728 RepID=A0A5N5MQ43_9ROSI|nr:hypothetical protein DKX38_008056 [Salix brachista]